MEKARSSPQPEQAQSSTHSSRKKGGTEINLQTMSSITSEDHNEMYPERREDPSISDGYESCNEKEIASPRTPIRYAKRQKSTDSVNVQTRLNRHGGGPREGSPNPLAQLSSDQVHHSQTYLFDLASQSHWSTEAVHREGKALRRRELEREKRSSLDEWARAGDKIFAPSSRNRQ